MLRTCRWITGGILLSAPVLLAQNAPAQTATSPETSQPTPAPAKTPVHKSPQHKKAHKDPKPVVLPALPSGPLRQMPMDQIPATPAKVTYQGGLLTIAAQNSTMGEILRDVRKLTGASIEIPPHAPAENERVITHIGPGTPRDVLVQLLNGSSFNYVMLGSNTDPAVVSNIILTSKTPGGETQTAANVPQPPPSPGIVMPPHPIAGGPQGLNPSPGDPNADAEDNADQENATDDNANPEEQPQPGQPAAGDLNGANGQQPDPNQPNAGPKTPEQILEMLRRQQPPGGNNNPNAPPPQQQ